MRFKGTPDFKYKDEYIITPIWTEKSVTKLINYGIYVGHSYKNTNYYNSWMVLGVRQGIHLLNLLKFQYMFRSALFAIDQIIRKGGPIWFVNLDKIVEKYTKKYATICGEYGITENWNHGFLTNFRMTSRRRTFKNKIVWRRKDKLLESNFENWALTRRSWPRMLFVSNVKDSYIACREADNLQIPTIGIVDSDAPTMYVDIAIPGNDEGVHPIIYYNSMIAQFVLYKKFNFIYQWYLGARSKIKEKKEDLFKSPLSIAFKAVELYPMRQLWQEARRDEDIRKKKSKNYKILPSTKFFRFYGKIINQRRWNYKKSKYLPSLFTKYFFFSKRFFKWKRSWKRGKFLRTAKAVRFINQLKKWYRIRGLVFRRIAALLVELKKEIKIFKNTRYGVELPITRRDRRRRRKFFKRTKPLRPIKMLKVRRWMKRFSKRIGRRKLTRQRYGKYDLKWSKILRSMLVKVKGRRRAIIQCTWRRLKAMKGISRSHPKVRYLIVLVRRLNRLNGRMKWMHKKAYTEGTRLDFLRPKSNAYDIPRPKALRKIRRHWKTPIKRRNYVKIRRVAREIKSKRLKKIVMDGFSNLNQRTRDRLLTWKPFRLAKRSKAARNMFSWWLRLWSTSKGIWKEQPNITYLQVTSEPTHNLIMEMARQLYRKDIKKRTRRKWKRKYWKPIKRRS